MKSMRSASHCPLCQVDDSNSSGNESAQGRSFADAYIELLSLFKSKVVEPLDISSAQATVEEDRTAILGMLQQDVGLDQVRAWRCLMRQGSGTGLEVADEARVRTTKLGGWLDQTGGRKSRHQRRISTVCLNPSIVLYRSSTWTLRTCC